MSAEESKAVLRRWYDEMWSKKNADLIPELVGPGGGFVAADASAPALAAALKQCLGAREQWPERRRSARAHAVSRSSREATVAVYDQLFRALVT